MFQEYTNQSVLDISLPHFRDSEANVGLNMYTSGNVQQGAALFPLESKAYIFHHFSCFSQDYMHTRRKCKLAIDYSTIKVMVILNNMTVLNIRSVYFA